MTPPTLFALAGSAPTPTRLPEATLVLIDFQNEYLAGPLAMDGAAARQAACSTARSNVVPSSV